MATMKEELEDDKWGPSDISFNFYEIFSYILGY